MLITVVTINLNNKPGLEETIESVVEQDCADWELIVIDGGSTDGSLEVLQRYDDQIGIWISEKDEGVFDAQNKGVERGKGDYFLFLNSGDTLYSADVFSAIFAKRPTADLLYGEALLQWADGRTHTTTYPDELRFPYFVDQYICHQALFFSARVFCNIGNYSKDYKYVGDHDLVYRILKERYPTQKISIIVCRFDMEGVSTDLQKRAEVLKEFRSTKMSHFPKRVKLRWMVVSSIAWFKDWIRSFRKR